ncbi:AAA family ATPase [Nocardia thailandica]
MRADRTTPPDVPDRLVEVVAAELAADAELGPDVVDTVLAAFGDAAAGPDPGADDTGVFLRAITVRGFRGIGPQTTLHLAPGPGLTLVAGRNGSGKSSFAEAAELALTGGNRRWDGRSTAWREGWRNLHDPDGTRIELDLLTAGAEPDLRIVKQWAPTAALSAPQWSEQRGDGSPAPFDPRRWRSRLELYRPFLSYSELGALVDGKPSDLFDALHRLLGLDDLSEAQERLRTRRLELERAVKEARQTREALVPRLAEVDDPRTRRLAALLREPEPDLSAIAAELDGAGGRGPGPAALRAVTEVTLPDAAVLDAALARLEAAIAVHTRDATADAEADLRVLDLLTRARAHTALSGSCPCPVCGRGALDADWARAADTEIALRGARVAALRAATAELDAARDALRALAAPLPPALSGGRPPADGDPEGAARPGAALPPPGHGAEPPGTEAVPAGTDEDPLWRAARAGWRRWTAALTGELGPDTAAVRKEHAEAVSALAALQQRARAELADFDEVWAPLAVEVTAWLATAHRVAADAEELRTVRRASDWLKAAAAGVRGERMRPLEDMARWVWSTLRQQSNVELGAIRLQGSAGTARRVLLDVTVDEVDGAALGVMSQGELHALGLSLFLPRATVPQSPFRFVVIDDPVQAMDPAKVDGLARVLAEVALTRQVVVFTHDERLAEAVRRMQIEATVLEVQRRERSIVEVRVTGDPVRRYLDDARSLLRTPQLPPAIADELVATCCRSAIEAAALAHARRNLLAAGIDHREVDRTVAGAHTTRAMVALAVMEPGGRVDDLNRFLSNTGGRWLVGILRDATAGAHVPIDRPMRELISDTERFIRWLRGTTPPEPRR